MMRISIVSDEISADFETAVELGTGWGVQDFELRGIGTERVPCFSSFQKQRLVEVLEEFGARLVAISPGLFKIPFPTKERQRFPLQMIDANLYQNWRDARSLVDYHLQELLPASLEYASKLGVQVVVIFSFQRRAGLAGPAPDEVLECLQSAARQAEKSGLQLAIEVEDQFWGDTGARTAQIVRAIGSPSLGVNWDPGNAILAGDTPYPDGYHAVKGLVRHVHFKDVIRLPGGDYRYEVHGEIDWAGQIRALAADGYDGFISVEPHMQPKVASASASYRRLSDLIEKES